MSFGEFELIKKYFNYKKKYHCDYIELGIGDDCALIKPPDNQILAFSTDTFIANVHFLQNVHPSDLAYKTLSVSISDLAAMGANPTCLTLSITLPKINNQWLFNFSKNLFKFLDYYNMQLIGGDTTRGPLSLTCNVFGFLPNGFAIKRSGAKLDDLIYVTGTLGDSAAGLKLLQNCIKIKDNKVYRSLVKKHLRPVPRLIQGKALRCIASAAIDISDGLISDIKHILNKSNCGAYINIDNIPLSTNLVKNFKFEQILYWALAGGEDYELCFTIPESNCDQLNIAFSNFKVPYTCIGRIVHKSKGLVLFKNGQPLKFHYKGFDHFI
ncbi:thiamine-phosphate kinase [Candidatus Pantoea edessiphila]|uniref:Thiamine-monophosphate kinase n=1 Tax=Candidatus Pantoea edessiphila TaxID=2044610 RepID=A0A2P5SXG9_9GAMM|nr:thiamine-phosphate kinase [Candidatus Pantoea edessiphila]MBK4775856.1 thiamine-phosphate kinase [Pantoea sp. Edef]PPI87025.1 thiamine-phosphate kinase [Candidatus Pantoea edessiphila]